MSGQSNGSSKGGAVGGSVDACNGNESIACGVMAAGGREELENLLARIEKLEQDVANLQANTTSSDSNRYGIATKVLAGVQNGFYYLMGINEGGTIDNSKKKKSTELSHNKTWLREQQEYDRKRLGKVELEEAKRRENNRKDNERRTAELKETPRREEEEEGRSMKAIQEEDRRRRDGHQRQMDQHNAKREKVSLERQRKDAANPELRNMDEEIKADTTLNEIPMETCEEKQREINEMKEKILSQKRSMEKLKEESAERSRKLQGESKHAARKMGQQSARLITNAIGQTYERGVRGGMRYVKDMFERAASKENGVLIVHDNKERSVEIAENLARVFRDRNFVVPPFIREDDQLPPCTTKCRLKWLVLYHILTDDRSRIRHTVSESNRYFSNEAFRDCAKCLIIQTGKMPDEHERSKMLNFPQETTVISSSAPDFHTEVIERALNNSESFNEAIGKMKSAAKSDSRCIFRA